MKKWLAFATAAAFAVFPSIAKAEDQASFTASQDARARGAEAFREGDLPTALAAMEEALTLRPTHPGLLGNVAYLAAATGDGQRAAKALEAYAALGLVPGEEIRAKVRDAVSAAAWQRLEDAFNRNSQPIGTAEIAAPLPAELHLVEGIARDTDGTFYIGTVVSSGIYRVTGDGTTKIVNAKDHEFGSFFGMSLHDGSLYATFARVEQTPGFVPDDGQTGLAKINPATGDVRKVWTLPGGTEGQQIADLCITANGTVYLSDAQGGTVYRVEGDMLEPAFRQEGFMSPQGIAELPGKGLYLADYGRGIWRLDQVSGEATLMDAEENTSLLGIDGLVAHEGELVAIQNGVNPQRVIALDMDGDRITGVRVLAQALEGWDEPTLGVSTGEGVFYIAASQWPKYGENGSPREGVSPPGVTPIMLIRD